MWVRSHALLVVLLPAAVLAARSGARLYDRLARIVRPQRCDLVVKLGGSAVTDKQSFERLDQRRLDATAAQLAARDGGRVALVHGAGSFGHFHARQHAVSKGVGHQSFTWLGFALTRGSVTRLNSLVVRALLAEGVPAVGIPAMPLCRTRAGALTRAGRHAIVDAARRALGCGMMPVFHGDATYDDGRGSAILSGDTLVEELCVALAPRCALFLTDVPGVYDRPPADPAACLLTEIRVDRRGRLVLPAPPTTATAEHDVTGGIGAKLEVAARVAAAGVPVCVCEAGSEHAAAALAGRRPQTCTLILRDGAAEPAWAAAPD